MDRRFGQPDGAKLALERHFRRPDGAKLVLDWRLGRPDGAQNAMESILRAQNGVEGIQKTEVGRSRSVVAAILPRRFEFPRAHTQGSPGRKAVKFFRSFDDPKAALEFYG